MDTLMAFNRRPPESPLIGTVFAVYQDGGAVPKEQAWLRFDVAQRFARLDLRWRRKYGFPLYVAALGRSPERSLELWPEGGGTDGHVVGAAFDAAYNRIRMEFKRTEGLDLDNRAIAAKLDPLANEEGFHPLGKTRWPDPVTGRKGDWQHYQTDDYGGARKIGPQAFASIEEARAAFWTPKPEEFDRLFAFAATRGGQFA